MNTLVFRNSSVEFLFKNLENYTFSDYDGIHLDDSSFDRYMWFYQVPVKYNTEKLVEEINDYRDRLNILVDGIPVEKSFYIFTLEPIGLIDFIDSDYGIMMAINNFNEYISVLSKKNKNIKLINFRDFMDINQSSQMIDWRYYFLSKAIINPKLSNKFQNWFQNKLNSLNLVRKKCLVLDLDNTLWGGVLGEDGLNGINLNENYPGNTFKRFQEIILQIKNTGVVLTICSKNNIEDVNELFEKHDEMVLKKEDFVIIKANWNNKAENIKAIASELNIGLDSFVFIDDNPSEREIVKSICNEVIVPDFPKKPYEIIEFIYDIKRKYFSVYEVTKEDQVKTKQYHDNLERKKIEKKSISIEQYIKNLRISITINKLNETNLSRFSQLTQKTNQFNLTTKRYSETDILKFSQSSSVVFGLEVDDKFGSYGITGVIMINLNESKAIIDNFLLSCRILGKDIESTFLTEILIMLKNDFSINEITAKYIPTAKNIQVIDFYDRNGFDLISEVNGVKEYSLNLERYHQKKQNILEIINNYNGQ